MSVTLQKLRYFVVLSEELSFTRAARRMYVSQQAFSKSVRELEAAIGASLFDRSSHGVALSAVGRCLIGPVRNALDLIDSSLAEAKALGGLTAPLRVRMVPSGGAGELTSAVLNAFRTEHPEITIELHEAHWEDPSGGVLHDQVDVAFARLPIDSDGLVVKRLFDEPLHMCVSSQHPLAARENVTLAEAVAEPLVLARKATPQWDYFWLLCEQRGGLPHVTATVGSILEEVETVAAGQASTFLPASTSRTVNHPGVRFLPVVGGPVSTVVLVWRAGRHASAVEAFVAVVERVITTETALMAALTEGRAPQ